MEVTGEDWRIGSDRLMTANPSGGLGRSKLQYLAHARSFDVLTCSSRRATSRLPPGTSPLPLQAIFLPSKSSPLLPAAAARLNTSCPFIAAGASPSQLSSEPDSERWSTSIALWVGRVEGERENGDVNKLRADLIAPRACLHGMSSEDMVVQDFNLHCLE